MIHVYIDEMTMKFYEAGRIYNCREYLELDTSNARKMKRNEELIRVYIDEMTMRFDEAGRSI